MNSLPHATDDPERLQDFLQIEELCDRHEKALQETAGRVLIEEVLSHCRIELREQAIQALVLRHLEVCTENRFAIDVDDLLARFPSAGAQIQHFINQNLSNDGSKSTLRIPDRSALSSRCEQSALLSLGPLDAIDLADDGRGASVKPDQLPSWQGHRQSIGTYKLLYQIGRGGFGAVYLAWEESLHRYVAIKKPTMELFRDQTHLRNWQNEARAAASLKHPNVLSIFSLGQALNELGELQYFIVMPYIDGGSLHDRLKRKDELSLRTFVSILSQIADALQCAHEKKLIHRDVKPGNILLDRSSDTPYLSDFGLAISFDDVIADQHVAGTPSYMSPEQALGAGHLVDHRTDIYSLGAILYEVLTGHAPFHDCKAADRLAKVRSESPARPSDLNPAIPSELERICLKAMARHVTHRYSTAREFAEDLNAWLASESNQLAALELRIRPRGLRPFGRDDADFFPLLVPGLRDRDQLPEQLQFWKRGLESRDPANAFRVGLLYGASGCGKTSLLQAGLLPRMDSSIEIICVEATSDDTESRLYRALNATLSKRPIGLFLQQDTLDLPSLCHAIRRAAEATAGQSRSSKFVLIIDQFEQWLHSNEVTGEAALVRALKQCDGVHLQAMLLIRDDFAIPAARLMRELDVRLEQDVNYAAVDLFNTNHASRVLRWMGRAMGRLPQTLSQMTDDQSEFVRSVVSELSEKNLVSPVRLAVFAEIVRDKPWTPATLEQLGGVEGGGVAFLEDCFGRKSIHADYLRHSKAAAAILKSLLPESTVNIKGRMRPVQDLITISGYSNRPSDFHELRRILDTELRIISPTDPDGHSDQSAQQVKLQCYQLTHDFLVPAVREWLRRQQLETVEGKAQLRLAEVAALWNSNSTTGNLPNLFEWMKFLRRTQRSAWSEIERLAMKKASLLHIRRIVTVLLLTIASIGTVMMIRESADQQRQEMLAKAGDEKRNSEAKRLIDGLLSAQMDELPSILGSLEEFRDISTHRLWKEFDENPEDSTARLHAAIAILTETGTILSLNNERIEKDIVPYIAMRSLQVSPSACVTIRTLIRRAPEKFTTEFDSLFRAIIRNESEPAPLRCRAVCMMPEVIRASSHTTESMIATDDAARDAVIQSLPALIATELTRINPAETAAYRELLWPARQSLTAPLATVVDQLTPRTLSRSLALTFLAEFASESPRELVTTALRIEPDELKALVPALTQQRETISSVCKEAVTVGLKELAKAQDEDLLLNAVAVEDGQEPPDRRHDRIVRETAAALTIVLMMGESTFVRETLVLPHPELIAIRAELIHRLIPAEIPFRPIEALCSFQPDASEEQLRLSLLLVGEYAAAKQLNAGEPLRLRPMLETLFTQHPNAGVHSAAEWSLRRLGVTPTIATPQIPTRSENGPVPEPQIANWYWTNPVIVNKTVSDADQTASADHATANHIAEDLSVDHVITMMIFEPQQFLMGSPVTESGRWDGADGTAENLHRRRIPHRFAAAAHEISIAQFQVFRPDYLPKYPGSASRLPAQFVSWYEAAAFCNWLSEREGIPREQWCYDADQPFEEGMMLREGFLSRTGYRLPTEAEWECVCRAGTRSPWFFGYSDRLLRHYSPHTERFADRFFSPCGNLKPNDFGLFDVYLNANEWTHDRYLVWEPMGGLLDLTEDLTPPRNNVGRVLRGGSTTGPTQTARSASRRSLYPDDNADTFGLRVFRTLPARNPENSVTR